MAEVQKKDKVCIVGCSDSKDQTPWHLVEEFEFWGVNNLFHSLKGPWSRWFEIHQITKEGKLWLRRGKKEFRGEPVEQYLEGLSKLGCPVYMQASNPLVPNAIPYPLDDVVKEFGTYFTNTISWQIALAIKEGFKEIRLVGVDMAVDTEYFWQRPSCEYFLGIAMGRNIKLILPDGSDLLKTRFLYGFQEHMELPFRNKLNQIRETIKRKQNKSLQMTQLEQKRVDQYVGALITLDEVDKIWKNVTGG